MKKKHRGIREFFILALTFTIGFVSSGGSIANAEAVAAKTTLFRSKSSYVQPILSEVPFITFKDSTSRTLSALEVENALKSFLASIPKSLSRQDKNVARETLSVFLSSAHRQKTIQHAMQNGIPIELVSLVPVKASESMTVQDFSKAFRFPLQFETGGKISPSAISIFIESQKILIEVLSQDSKRTFVVRPR